MFDIVERYVTWTVVSDDPRDPEFGRANGRCDMAHHVMNLFERDAAAVCLRGSQRQAEQGQVAFEKRFIRKIAEIVSVAILSIHHNQLMLGWFAATTGNRIQRPDDARMPSDRTKDRQEVLDPCTALAF